MTLSLLDFPDVRKKMDELILIVLNGETADIKCWCYAHKEYCSRGRESVGKDSTALNLGLLGSPCVVSWLNCFVVLESDFMNPRLIQKWNKKNILYDPRTIHYGASVLVVREKV